jgi:hypothetical protein
MFSYTRTTAESAPSQPLASPHLHAGIAAWHDFGGRKVGGYRGVGGVAISDQIRPMALAFAAVVVVISI